MRMSSMYDHVSRSDFALVLAAIDGHAGMLGNTVGLVSLPSRAP
jgi:hypothetical protein